MELRQLRYLDAVARRRSFTQAALDLHIAQSALSQQVGRLERELGVELLRRTTRRVEVTEAGELVLARARRALTEVDGVRADLDALRGLVRGTLRLGGVPPVGPVHPAALIADFSRAHPGVAITVREDVAFTLLGRLRDGGLDLVMALVDPDASTGSRACGCSRRSSSSSLPWTIPSRGPSACASSAWRARRWWPTAPGRRCATRSSSWCRSGRVVAEANELETVLELTARGLGVTLMPRSVVASHGDRLAIRPLSPRHALPVSLVWRAGERPTPAAQAFREHVLSTMRA